VKFSKMCDYKNEAHFIVKTGRKNIRILKPGDSYDKSFVVPIRKTSNRRPSDGIEPDEDEDETPEELSDQSELTDPNEQIEEEDSQEETEFQPQ